ncbi:hypothetical protein PV08_06133 [Exophiala spinifera]|uniref:Uncharacterized protein n=1 Tax=Exophiala spinifera TaxID=91928 RepID=A0A0D1ZTI1_9EURO|nr:uncharacterized protein PV08_06133 [Exophiala spinifera]KIW16082.1 hypothetical protein PV08_06133 [Exophiala spinifera]
MRLLKLGSHGDLSLTKNLIEDVPSYAVLSHTWGTDDDEVTFDDIKNGSGTSKVGGYAKIRFCGEQARRDGLQYFWVDTCCIDKENHAELAQAIASMFRWYQNAARCYVYLTDVSARKCHNSQAERPWESAFGKSRWFTRGWTLQELLAPKSVEFYSHEGERLGDRNTLEQEIHETTEIPLTALRGTPLSHFSVDERLRWAAKRHTKLKEDKAYCLLGIFNVFLPLIYGEEDNAFIRLREEIDKRLRSKLDLDKLPHAKGAMFNAYGGDHRTCHPATRVDLLCQIQNWAQQPRSKTIFWLNGMAGTGKSTISWTFAEWLTNQGHFGLVNLGGSFFFKRGDGDRGSASRFFSTITRQLVLKIQGMDTLIANVITSDPLVFDKALGEQFDKLIYQPLCNVSPGGCPILVLVVDALDECEKEGDIKIILDLCSRLSQISTIRLKLFLTSRPDLPVRLGFKSMSVETYQDLILQDAVPRTTIRHDISVFLKDAFSEIRANYNADPPLGGPLGHGWPGENVLEGLVDMAVPLFIVAATVCRFVGDPNWDPQEQLQTILKLRATGHLEQMEQTYLPVLTQLSATLSNSRDKEKLFQEFRTIVGSLVTLAEPLSATSLAALLSMPSANIARRLRPLHSVLQVPADAEIPIRTLHLSFREFLLSDKLQHEPFGVDGPATHRMLLTRCLQLLSGSNGLHENLCDLSYPGQLRREIDPSTIEQHLPPVVQYACRYWVHHVQHGMVQIHNEDEVHVFLQKHFLHWLEALSLMNRISEVIGQLGILQSLMRRQVNASSRIAAFLEDAQRVVLANRYIADLAPLQIYSSAMIFAPQTSIVRNICSQTPIWIQRYPITPVTWSAELQKLEGHSDSVNAVTFSPDDSLLASAADDGTVKLWNSSTGQEVQTLNGHTKSVTEMAFSPDGSLLASTSSDQTVSLWNSSTGQEVQMLRHSEWRNVVAFSPDGSLLTSALSHGTIKLWNLSTGQIVQTPKRHSDRMRKIIFSPNGSLLAAALSAQTIMLWDSSTGQEVLMLNGLTTGSVTAMAFSPDSSLLACASSEGTIKLWNLSTGQIVQTLRNVGWVIAITLSSNGSLLASAHQDTTIELWNLSTGRKMQILEGHTKRVNALTFSHNGSLLASGSTDQTVRLWNLTKGQEVPKLQEHRDPVQTVAFSHDGSLLASISNNESIIRLWSPNTGQEVQRLQGHTGLLHSVAFSHDDLLLASTSSDGTVRLWNLTTGQEVQKLEGHTFCDTRAVAFSLNDSLLASVLGDRTVRLWTPTTGQEIQKLKGNPISRRARVYEFIGHDNFDTVVAFSHNGSLLASVFGDSRVWLWDLKKGLEAYKLNKHTGFVKAVAFSHDDSLLASASGDRTVKLWNLRTGQVVQTLEGHTGSVKAVAFSHDGSFLASASDDQTARLWNLSTGREVQKFENVPAIETLRFTIDDKTLLTNRGAISIDGESITHGSSTASMVKNDWVQRGHQNLLWLPQEYRSNCSAFYDNTFAIGLHSGQVIFLHLDQT